MKVVQIDGEYPRSFVKSCTNCGKEFTGTHGQLFCGDECSGSSFCKECGKWIQKRTGRQYSNGQTCRSCQLGQDRDDAIKSWISRFPQARNIRFDSYDIAHAELPCPFCDEFFEHNLPSLSRKPTKKVKRTMWPHGRLLFAA